MAIIVGWIYHSIPVFAQFSPGELSRAHQQLEGLQQCTKCHEVGNTIEGKKCLGCHTEIDRLMREKRGFHSTVSGKQCVVCHKDHLGKDAATFQFDPKTFDHAQTGFRLTGKHERTSCSACHSRPHITDAGVMSILAEHPHETYLGVSSECRSCHQDPHAKKFGENCGSCHTSASWTQVQSFDHSKTRFLLTGKHATVKCEKCHQGLKTQHDQSRIDFSTKSSSDCTPCHTSPHVSTFGGAFCSSCHTAEGWEGAFTSSFDHRTTRYRLVGKHRTLQCEQCHHRDEQSSFAAAFLLRFNACIDCHRDKHNGEFAKRYNNNCARCHTQEGYSPSTFTPADHNKSRFSLTGAHAATLCSDCHRRGPSKLLTFRFSSVRCDVCHADIHKGQFSSQMTTLSCGACHRTRQWSLASFDHAATSFPLTGKHAALACRECHKEPGAETGRFQKVSGRCESCHRDAHQGQFVTGGGTACERCHRPEGWTRLVFDHDTQSGFPLTGAHRNVPCRACHRTEQLAGSSFLRFTPLPTTCAGCHQKGMGK